MLLLLCVCVEIIAFKATSVNVKMTVELSSCACVFRSVTDLHKVYRLRDGCTREQFHTQFNHHPKS
jgi:hypothetical protein